MASLNHVTVHIGYYSFVVILTVRKTAEVAVGQMITYDSLHMEVTAV